MIRDVDPIKALEDDLIFAFSDGAEGGYPGPNSRLESIIHELSHAAVEGIDAPGITQRGLVRGYEKLTKWVQDIIAQRTADDSKWRADLTECRTLAIEVTVCRRLGMPLFFENLIEFAVTMTNAMDEEQVTRRVMRLLHKPSTRRRADGVVSWLTHFQQCGIRKQKRAARKKRQKSA